MARGIGSLFVEFRATVDKFQADLKRMSKDTAEFERTLKPLRQQALNIGSAMTVVGGAVTGAFIGMARQAANYGDAIRDASIRTGVSTQALSGLKLAAEQTGTGFEGVNASLTRLSRASLAAAQGSKQAAGAFASIGVSVKDASGQLRPMDAILGDVADRFSKLKDGTEKAALAQQLFGRNGAVMIEFLNQGKDGLAAFQKQAEALGLVLGEDAVAAADQFNDSLNLLKNAQLGLSVTLGNMVLPALIKVVDVVTNAVVRFRQFAGAHPELTRAIFVLAGAITGAGGLLVGFAGLLAILPALKAAFLLLAGAVSPVTIAITAFVAAMLAFPKFRGIVSDVLKNVIGLFTLLGSQIGSVASALLSLAKGQFSQAWNTIKTAGTRSVDEMVAALDAYDSAISFASGSTNLFTNTVTATGPALDGMGIDLDAVGGKADNLGERLAELSNFLRGAETNLEAPIARFARNSIELLGHLGSAVDTVKVKLGSVYLGPLISQTEQLDFALEHLGKMRDKVVAGQAEITAEQQRTQEEARRQFEQSVNDVKQSAGKIFDDMFIRGENVFKSLGNALKGGALSLGRAIFQDITGALLGPIKAAFDNFFKGILQKGLGGITGGIGNKLGSAIGGGGSVTGSVGSVAGSGAGLSGSLLSGGLAAVGGIVGGLLTKGNAKRTEEHTRETRDLIELAVTAWNPLFHQQTFYQKGIYEAFKGLSSVSNGKVSQVVTNVQPTAAAQTIDASFNPVFNVNVAMEGGGNMTDIEVRDELMPKITTALETGVRGYRERWSQLLVIDGLDGNGRTRPANQSSGRINHRIRARIVTI